MNVLQILQKIAAEGSAISDFAAANPEVSLLPLSAAAGAAMVHKTRKQPATDLFRGALTGLGTGAGILGGAALGRRVSSDPSDGMMLGGATGGLLSFLAARKLLQSLQPAAPKKREKRSIGPVLGGLLQAKQLSDQRNFRSKHLQLRQLIEQHPDDFFIDSEKGGIVGITHKPTGFRVHAPSRVLPAGIKRMDADVEAISN